MNAAEFIAITEKHKLPWVSCGDGMYRVPADGSPISEGVEVDIFPLDDALRDAAPAMAAAILKYLGPDATGRQRVRSWPEAVALRASLPPELRS